MKKNNLLPLLVTLLVAVICGCAHQMRPGPRTFLSDKDLGVAVLSPDDRTIVFSVAESSGQLYSVNTDGSNLVAIGDGFDPTFSPDGTKMAFVRITNGQGDICVSDNNGKGSRCISTGPDHDFEPVFSPDGGRIYLIRSSYFGNYSPIARPGWHDMHIYAINIDGTGLKRITSQSQYRMSDLSVSPKGDTLMALVSVRIDGEQHIQARLIPINNPENIGVLRPDLAKYRKNTVFGPKEIDYDNLGNPRFSPDGAHAIFTWAPDSSPRDIYLVDLKTNYSERIWTLPLPLWTIELKGNNEPLPSRMYPRFSHDGRRVIFSTLRRSLLDKFPDSFAKFIDGRLDYTIWIVNSDGSGLKTVNIQ